MLDPKVLELVDTMIRVYFEERREQLQREINEVQAKAAAHGMGRSGHVIVEICKLCSHDIEIRTLFLWQTLRRVLSETGIVPSEALAQELKDLVTRYSSAITGLAFLHSEKAAEGTPIKPRQGLEDAVTRAMTKVYSEIDLFILSLVRHSEIRDADRESPQPIFNFYSGVGAVQTGPSAIANIVMNIGAEERDVLLRALDLVKEALAGVNSLPAHPTAEIIELVDEVKSEIEKPKPNGTRLGSLASTIATAIQTAGSLQPAYQALKAALLPFGILLP